MTLKEVRISKRLTQQEAAKILGVSRRKYQYLEKDDVDTSTKYYQLLLKELETYEEDEDDGFNFLFSTAISFGEATLNNFYSKVKDYKKRYCFKYLLDYINDDNQGKICILYGLRRTGKTTLLFQLFNEIDKSKTAYIKISDTDTMAALIKDLNILNDMGFKYIFIDEITLLEDFINSAAVLSDIYSMQGMKIILSGTDSLAFSFADIDELYDRNIMIHTSYIPFGEFSYLLDINDIDKYIEYGGTLKVENMSFDDPDYKNDEVPFKEDESTRKYIDSAISRNIQRSLKNNKLGSMFASLKELYDRNELTNAINRIIEKMNHDFLVSVIIERFKSRDLGSAKQLLLHQKDQTIQTALYDIDAEKVLEVLKNIIDVKEKEELSVPISEESLRQIKEYLYKLDLIKEVDVIVDNKKTKRVIFTQPGMRYSIAKALVFSLLEDSYFSTLSIKDKNLIIDKILDDVKGRMLEDIVLLETSNKMNKGDLVFKYVSYIEVEIDMVHYHLKDDSFDIYEIKHSDKVSFIDQTKFIKKESLINMISSIYGSLKDKYVLYRGEDSDIEDIHYINVEKYLKSL